MHKAETSLHSLFAAYRLRSDGEWFKLDEQANVLLRKVFGALDTTDRENVLLKGLGLR